MNIHKKKIIIIIIIFFLLSFILEFFIILPTLNDIKKINNDIQKEKKDLEMKFQQGQFLKKVITDYKSVEPRRKELDALFIKKGDELGFITDLEKISQKYNLEPTFTKLNNKNDSESDVSEMLLTIKLGGGFTQTLLFLSELETLQYYFNISKISLASVNKQNNVSSDIIGTAYILEEQKKP